MPSNISAIFMRNPCAKGTGNNNWYTPARYIEAARTVLGEIDLDPASDARGQSVVQAKHNSSPWRIIPCCALGTAGYGSTRRIRAD